MKQKCSFILRASLAIVLTVLMVLGSVSTVIAAVADVAAGDDALPLAAKKGFDIAATGADADVAETGAISKITAQVTGKTSHSSTTFPLEFTESLTKDSWYGIRINFTENGDHYCKASDNNNITVGTAKELGWGNGNGNNDSGMSWFQATKDGTFSFSIYTSGGKNYVLVSEAKTPLSTPSITIGGQSSAVNVTSGSSTTVAITNFSSKFSDAATTAIYTLKLYKEGSSTAITRMTTASTTFTPDASAKYYVKCEPTSSYASSWSESTSNKVDVTLTKDTTIYVKKALASTFSNIHIWSNNNDNWTGDWPGQALSGWTKTSDGNYYHKTFTNSYSDFKLILNNNSSPQTIDSDAYATGKSYYIDSATASQKAVLTEGVPQASTITYNTGTGYTIGGTKPTSAYTGETVSFTVSASSGYRIDKVQYTPTGGTATTITASSGTYSFTMPDKDVTVSVTAVKTYTVTLTAGTGIKTKQYKLGSSGTYKPYSSALTVDSGTDVYFKVTYSDGYEFDSQSGGTQVTAKTEYRTGAVTGDKTVTINAKKINYTVTYPNDTGYTIGGNKPSTATINDTVSFTVTPDTGYRINSVKYQYSGYSSSTTLTGTNNAYSFTLSTAKDVSILVNASKVNTVKAVTNKTSRGTISVDKSTAAKDEVVKITVSPAAGILKTLTATYTASGNTYECAVTNGTAGITWTKVIASGGAAAPLKARGSVEIAEVGANIALAAVGASQTVNMTMQEDSAVTINATFDAYSGDSTWYYNGYDTSGNAVSGYHGKQMTEGMVSGEKFSYYHVEGRTGTDQLMTVSDGVPSSGTRYVYFVRPNDYGDGWSASNNPKAHFWKNGGQDYDTWPGTEMSWQWNNDYGQGVYKIAIPDGADRVSFNDATNTGTHQTVDIDLTTTSGAYYVGEWNSTYSKYDYGTWDTGWADQGWVDSGTEYFYQNSTYNGDYTGDFNTKGFYNHYTASKEFAKPKDLRTNTGDYYINVLYPNTSYTINGVTKTTGSNPMIIWSAESLAGDDENVTVYAKDGSIRSESSGSTYANIADTKIYLNNATVGTKHSGNITNQTWETYKAAKGDTIVIKTQIGATDSSTLSNAADLKAKYYVRGFCVNGEVSELLQWNADGLYTLTYKVPEDYEGTKIEITPIYYLKDTTAYPIVTYRVTGFTDELKAVGTGKPGWGDTLYTYPFYGKLGSNNNALGAYPGQPMVYYKGQYQMQIPQKSTAWDIYESDSALGGKTGTAAATAVANTAVSGVTMSNGYYDIVHRQVMGYGSNGASSDHVQTYDYGDFYKIFNEKEPVDNIVFDFKYRTKKHNFENQPANSITKNTLDTNYGTNGNGFELLTNFHGRHVDLFGTPLSGDAADPDKTTPVYVISIGGVNGTAGVENIAGYYATEWMVYGSNDGSSYSRISADGKNSIPPEVLVLNNNSTSFNDTTYPSADANHTLTDWKALYTALEAYRGKPVMISYEAADAQIGAGNYATSGGGGATRNDGRWLYSKNGETITSKIRVDVSEDNGATYTPNTERSTPVENLDAYFTNAEADGETTYTTTIDPDKTFDFEAHSGNEDYKFMGWYMEDGTKITTDNIGHTERSGSYTFVARFMHFTGGQLILGHKVAKDSTYTGDGTATIAVTVKNGDEIVREWDASSSDITIDDKIINNVNTAYTIEVTLDATPAGEDSYARTTCSAADTFFGGHSTYTTMPQTFSFTVGDLFSGNTQQTKKITYNSYFNQVTYTYKYTFNFPSRGSSSNDKSYVREGTLTAAQRKDYVTGTGNESRVLSEAFVNSLAPHESNFNQTLTWSISATDRTFTKDGSNYTLTKTVNAVDRTAQVDGGATPAQGEVVRTAKRTATFNLPYAHSDGVPSNIEIMDKAESTNYVISGISYGSLVKNHGDDGYVVAPRQLNDGGTVKNFQYWSVKSTDAAGENDPDVARCYFYSFNFVAYDNYVITPVYDTGSTPFGNSNRTSTSITYLESSRNQFNGTGVTTTNMATAADILYNDFVLSYEYNGKDIYKNDDSSSDVSQIGYVVERVQKLEVGQDGTPYTDPNHYSDVTVKSEEEIKNMISSNTGKTVATSGTLTKYTLTKNSLDNKNRVEFYESYINSKGWNKDTQKPQQTSGYKNYVYKAYTYMIVNGVVTLSAPAYFTMYSEATM